MSLFSHHLRQPSQVSTESLPVDYPAREPNRPNGQALRSTKAAWGHVEVQRRGTPGIDLCIQIRWPDDWATARERCTPLGEELSLLRIGDSLLLAASARMVLRAKYARRKTAPTKVHWPMSNDTREVTLLPWYSGWHWAANVACHQGMVAVSQWPHHRRRV